MAIKRKRIAPAGRRDQIIMSRGTVCAAGISRTTTRQIADQARVNEAILFRHFRSKEALYWAVLDELTPQRNSRANLQTLMRSASKAPK